MDVQQKAIERLSCLILMLLRKHLSCGEDHSLYVDLLKITWKPTAKVKTCFCISQSGHNVFLPLAMAV